MIDKILALRPKERYCADCSEDICKQLKLLKLQQHAYENLFMAYVNRTSEQADAFNLEAFLHAYAKLFVAENTLVDNAVINIVGKEGLDAVRKRGIRYMVNYNLYKLVFFAP